DPQLLGLGPLLDQRTEVGQEADLVHVDLAVGEDLLLQLLDLLFQLRDAVGDKRRLSQFAPVGHEVTSPTQEGGSAREAGRGRFSGPIWGAYQSADGAEGEIQSLRRGRAGFSFGN